MAISGVFLACAAIAQGRFPADVERFIERRDACDHFRGEEAYDAGRRKFLEEQTLKLCVGTDRRLADLKMKYGNDKAVMGKLSEYEAQIESGSSK